nr:hypothetical protein [uncultured Porphyromonas sp.]
MNIFAYTLRGIFSLLHAQRRPREISFIDDDPSTLCSMYRYIYLLLLIALGCGGAYAQQSFSAPGGFTIHVGDSLQFGLPAPGKGYAYVFDRLSQEQEELPSRFKEALPFSRAKVEGYKLFASDSTSAKLDTILVLRHPRFPDDSLFLDLSWAVISGEVLVSDPTHTPLFPEAKELTPDLYVPALLRAGYLAPGEIAKELYLNFVSTIREDTLASDSPEYQQFVTRATAELLRKTEAFDLGQVYYMSKDVTCSGYNAKRGGYPVEDLFLGGFSGTPPRHPGALFPANVQVKGDVPFVAVPAKRARRYEQRSSSVGSDIHLLSGRVYFVILPASKPPRPEAAHLLPTIKIRCRGLDLYEFAHCEYYHLGSGHAIIPLK